MKKDLFIKTLKKTWPYHLALIGSLLVGIFLILLPDIIRNITPEILNETGTIGNITLTYEEFLMYYEFGIIGALLILIIKTTWIYFSKKIINEIRKEKENNKNDK